MNHTALLAAFFLSASTFAAEGTVLDPMEQAGAVQKGQGPANAKAEVVEGKVGKAVKYSFDKDAKGVYVATAAKGTPEWDTAAGLSFWVKGDGSEHCGGIEFIWNDDYAIRYAACFSIKGTDWQKVMIPWRDFECTIPKEDAKPFPLDAKNGNAPSKLGQLRFGRWWFWKDWEAHSYTIDQLSLEKEIPLDNTDYKPKGDPLARVAAKLKSGKPVTVVLMGDSLTDYDHWANKEVNWPTLFKAKLKEKFKSDATIVNSAIGGTELRTNIVLIPKWIQVAPEPDLVTIFIGGNDFGNGMHKKVMTESMKDCIERVRRATKGKADILVMTTAPATASWDTIGELADGCRDAAKEENAGLVDVFAAFHEDGKTDKAHLYATDSIHLGKGGHELVAKLVADALEKSAK